MADANLITTAAEALVAEAYFDQIAALHDDDATAVAGDRVHALIRNLTEVPATSLEELQAKARVIRAAQQHDCFTEDLVTSLLDDLIDYRLT